MTTEYYLRPPVNYAEIIFDKISTGALDEVIALAKEYDINSTTVRVPSRQYDVIERIKQRLTVEKIDWTTL
jgi:hypothetical protein